MTLKYFEYGSDQSPTILFLHGLGVSSWMWQDQIETLRQNFHCLAVDLPGNGDSFEEEWVSFSETAASLANLIQSHAKNGMAHVVGLSLGGYTALRLLAEFPEHVASTLVSGVTIQPFPDTFLYNLLPRVVSRTTGWNMTISIMSRIMQLPPEVKPLYRRDSKRLTAETINRIYDEVLSFTFPPVLHQRQPKLLAVAGEKEARLVLSSLPDFLQIETAVTAIAPNAHHGWNGEFPHLFSQMVAAWVDNQPLPTELEVKSHPKKVATARL